MAERTWERATAAIAVVVAIGATYYVSQTAIDANRVELKVQAYIDCIHKVSTIQWDDSMGPKPSSSDVCKDLTSRETV